MRRLEVLLEGHADVPTVREILTRRFGLVEGEQFRLYPHQGKGSLPEDILSGPPANRRGLLDQLPAKLRGLSHLGDRACVVVLLDADKQPCRQLLANLNHMLERLPKRPAHVLFRIAVEETESWFIADTQAVLKAFPRARTHRLRRIAADEVVGASERLAEALDARSDALTGMLKITWAERIAPHLDLTDPPSPSLRKFIDGVSRHVEASP